MQDREGQKVQLSTRIALKFLRKPGSRYPSFTALVSVAGVSVGVAAFIVVVTVFNSFESQLRDTLLGANPNLVVHNFPKSIPAARALEAQLVEMLGPQVRRTSLFEYNEALLSKDGRTATVIIKGIEGSKAASAIDLRRFIKPPEALSLLAGSKETTGSKSYNESDLPDELDSGTLDSKNHARVRASAEAPLPVGMQHPPILLGRGLALKLGAQVGQVVNLSSGTFGYASRHAFETFSVVGIIGIGLAQYDEKLAFISFSDGVRLFGEEGEAKGVEITLTDPSRAQELARELDQKIPYRLRPWQEIDSSLFRQIERDGQAVRLIVLIITLVAAFNIIVTLSLSVVDRSKQIATLRALGARRRDIVRVFVVIGSLLGTAGAAFGVVGAVVVLQIFAGFELGELKEFYFVDRIPVHYDWLLMSLAFLSAVGLSFLSAFYPAFKATRVSPLLGLKPWS
jgi:lipoprotein-releasing system permease protein